MVIAVQIVARVLLSEGVSVAALGAATNGEANAGGDLNVEQT